MQSSIKLVDAADLGTVEDERQRPGREAQGQDDRGDHERQFRAARLPWGVPLAAMNQTATEAAVRMAMTIMSHFQTPSDRR